jgi:prolyl oligopeptidase
VTYGYLNQIPFRDALKTAWRNYGIMKIGAPSKEGNFTYYSKNDGLQNQSVMYRKDAAGKEDFLRS